MSPRCSAPTEWSARADMLRRGLLERGMSENTSHMSSREPSLSLDASIISTGRFIMGAYASSVSATLYLR